MRLLHRQSHCLKFLNVSFFLAVDTRRIQRTGHIAYLIATPITRQARQPESSSTTGTPGPRWARAAAHARTGGGRLVYDATGSKCERE